MKSDKELLEDYWAAQAQFGPLDVGPDEFVRRCHEAPEETPECSS